MAMDLGYPGEWGMQRIYADWFRETITKEKLTDLDTQYERGRSTVWKRMVTGSEVRVMKKNKGSLFIVKGIGLAKNMKSLLSGIQPLVWQQDMHHEKSIKQVHKWDQSLCLY